MWDLHDRLGETIDVESCRSLIRSLQRNGQRHPVLGRCIADGSGYRYELVYGARRLFAAWHLGVPLLVDVRDLDDRTALVEMDIENRVRKDISPYERGISYKRWLRAGYFKSQAALARSLGISEAQISRLLRYADLPAVVVASFRSPCDIHEEWAVVLAKYCADPDMRQKVIRRARACVASHRNCPPRAIYEQLIHVGRCKPPNRSRETVVRKPDGEPLIRLSFRTRTVHFILSRKVLTPALAREITEHIKDAVQGRDAERPLTSAAPARTAASHAGVVDLPRRANGQRHRVAGS